MISPDQARQIAAEFTGRPDADTWVGVNADGYVVEYLGGADPYSPDFVFIDGTTGAPRVLGSSEYIGLRDTLTQV